MLSVCTGVVHAPLLASALTSALPLRAAASSHFAARGSRQKTLRVAEERQRRFCSADVLMASAYVALFCAEPRGAGSRGLATGACRVQRVERAYGFRAPTRTTRRRLW
jgi:hypothetical protein